MCGDRAVLAIFGPKAGKTEPPNNTIYMHLRGLKAPRRLYKARGIKDKTPHIAQDCHRVLHLGSLAPASLPLAVCFPLKRVFSQNPKNGTQWSPPSIWLIWVLNSMTYDIPKSQARVAGFSFVNVLVCEGYQFQHSKKTLRYAVYYSCSLCFCGNRGI